VEHGGETDPADEVGEEVDPGTGAFVAIEKKP